VETPQQVNIVVITSVILGFLFGFVFGVLDVEDAQLSRLRIELMRDESIVYPIGAIVGGVATAYNQYLREKNDTTRYDYLNDRDLDEEF
jgi:hypothetical protein